MVLEIVYAVLASSVLTSLVTFLFTRKRDKVDLQSKIISSEAAFIKRLEGRLDKQDAKIEKLEKELAECVKARDKVEKRLSAIENGGTIHDS